MPAPKQLTKQQAFDKICRHLKKQRACALSRIGTCAYRGQNGTKCAVGCLIPDELYEPGMEGQIVESSKVGRLFPPALIELLFACQTVHDNQACQAKPKFKAGLKAVAARFGLVWRHG